MSIGFHRHIRTREQEISSFRTTYGNYQVIVYLNDVFAFAEHQENTTYGLGHKILLKLRGDSNASGHRSRIGADDAAMQTDFERED